MVQFNGIMGFAATCEGEACIYTIPGVMGTSSNEAKVI